MAKIDFQVSVAGQPCTVISLSYDPREIPQDVATSPSRQMRWTMDEAMDHLREEVGHNDFEVVYWWWL